MPLAAAEPCAVIVGASAMRAPTFSAELTRPAALLVLLVAVQVTLGAFVILSGKQPVINTAHVANRALVLVTSLALTLWSRHPRPA